MSDYEYCAQWYADGSDSWLPSGWRGDNWGSLNKAKAERRNFLTGIWEEEHIRIVRRVKAGPIEVVEVQNV